MNIQFQRSDSPWNIQNSSTFSHQDHVPKVFPLATMHITSIHHVYFLLSCARLCMSNQCSVHLRTILQACLDICLQVHLCSSYLAPIEPYHGCKDISVCVHLTLYSPSSTDLWISACQSKVHEHPLLVHTNQFQPIFKRKIRQSKPTSHWPQALQASRLRQLRTGRMTQYAGSANITPDGHGGTDVHPGYWA